MRATLSSLIHFTMCASLLLCLSSVAEAQFKASLQGTIKDQSGAVIPGTPVSVTNQETGRTQQVVASDSGFYRVAGLSPGRYRVSVEQPGFEKVTINVEVNAEETRGVDITLAPSRVAQEITVSSETETQLHTEDANVSRAITTVEIQRLPQLGRDPYELLRLTPGVFGDGARDGSGNSVGLPNTTGPGGSNTSIFQTENQVPISANGQRLSANDYLIDGVSVNSLTWGGAAVVTPNQESVKELRVMSNTYSAEDGRNSGAQVKVVSQNGTNELHGSAMLKYNDPALNAFNKYGGPGAPPVRVNNHFRQFGGGIGGPIIKDKLFFFFSYEGLRNNTTDAFTAWVETPQYRQLVQTLRPNGTTAKIFGLPGITPRLITQIPVDCSQFGNDASRCRVVAGGLDLGSPTGSLNNYVGLGNPTGGGFDGIPDVMFGQFALPGRTRGNQFNGRVDYNRGNDQFAVSMYFTRQNTDSSDAAGRSRPMEDLNFKPANSAATVTWLRTISPTLLNEAKANFTRFQSNQVQSSAATNFGIPRIEVEGLPFDRIRFGADRQETTPAVFAQNTIEIQDTLSKIIGNHALKFGAEIRKEQDNNNLVGGARPLYSFSGLFNLANDTPIFEAINADPRSGGPADAQRYFRTGTYAFFVQHDWKFRPNLTFNMGVRYEYFTPLREHRGQLSNLAFGPHGLVDSKVEVIDQLYNPDRNNFAPRLGFAWNPHAFNERIVVRGGFGVSYNRIPNVLFANTRGNPPFMFRYNLCCGTASTDFGSPFDGGQILYSLGASSSPFSFPVNPALAQGIDPISGGPAAGSVEMWGAPPDLRTAYVYVFSLETEYRLPGNFVANLGYQGSSGHKLIRLVNQNFLQAPNPKFFQVFFVQPDVNSDYHAMLIGLKRRFARGFQLDAHYRWSKSIDTLSYEGPGAVTNQTNPANLASERGPSDYDATHYFVMSGLWDLPIFRNRKDLLGKALGGWEINGILTAHSGFPWTPKTGRQASVPVTGADTISPTRPVAYFGGALSDSSNDAFIRPGGNFPGGGLVFFDISHPGPPGIGRNSFRGPKYKSVDFSLVKQTGLPHIPGLGENAKLDIRFNLFNAFNTLNLKPLSFFDPGTFVEDANFGRSPGGLAGRVAELQLRFSF
jgi:hypothetical protein